MEQVAIKDIEPDMRFLIIDDHPLFREALKFALFSGYPEAEVTECASFGEAVSVLNSVEPFDLVLLDLRIPDVSGFDGIIQLRALNARLPIVIVSGMEDPAIIRSALSYGVAGFIPKSSKKNELTAAITSVINGEIFVPEGYKAPDENLPHGSNRNQNTENAFATFTPQQLKVINMIRNGLLNKQIAFELGVSETTVKAHVSKILKKLGVTNRTQAAMEIEKLSGMNVISLQEKFEEH